MRRSVVTATLALVLSGGLVAGCTSDGTGTTDNSGAAASSPAETAASSAPPATGAPASPDASAPAASAPASSSGGAVSFSSLTGTETRLTIDGTFLSTLQTLGVSLEPDGGASVDKADGKTTFVFPVTGGDATLDPSGSDPFTGTVQHRGGLKLSALGRSVTIDGLVLDGGKDQLTADVAGREVPLLPLSPGDAKVTTEDGSATLRDDAVSLSADAANDIAKSLGLPTLPQLTFGALQVTLTGS